MSNPFTKTCAGLVLLCLASLPVAGAQTYESEISVNRNVARAAERRAHRLIRQQARAHESNAMLLAEAGRTSEAIEEDRAAIAADPEQPGYRILLASLLIDAGKLKCALHVYEHVCAHFPDQTPYLADSMMQLRLVLNLLAIEHALGEDDGPITELNSPSVSRRDADAPASQPVASSGEEQVIVLFSKDQSHLSDQGLDLGAGNHRRSSLVKRAASLLFGR